jgi:hypothetical protein
MKTQWLAQYLSEEKLFYLVGMGKDGIDEENFFTTFTEFHNHLTNNGIDIKILSLT